MNPHDPSRCIYCRFFSRFDAKITHSIVDENFRVAYRIIEIKSDEHRKYYIPEYLPSWIKWYLFQVCHYFILSDTKDYHTITILSRDKGAVKCLIHPASNWKLFQYQR